MWWTHEKVTPYIRALIMVKLASNRSQKLQESTIKEKHIPRLRIILVWSTNVTHTTVLVFLSGLSLFLLVLWLQTSIVLSSLALILFFSTAVLVHEFLQNKRFFRNVYITLGMSVSH